MAPIVISYASEDSTHYLWCAPSLLNGFFSCLGSTRREEIAVTPDTKATIARRFVAFLLVGLISSTLLASPTSSSEDLVDRIASELTPIAPAPAGATSVCLSTAAIGYGQLCRDQDFISTSPPAELGIGRPLNEYFVNDSLIDGAFICVFAGSVYRLFAEARSLFINDGDRARNVDYAFGTLLRRCGSGDSCGSVRNSVFGRIDDHSLRAALRVIGYGHESIVNLSRTWHVQRENRRLMT